MRTLFILCFAVCVAGLPVLAQESGVDAMMEQQRQQQLHLVDSLKQLTFDTELDALLNLRNIIRAYRDVEMDSAMVYSEKELALAATLSDANQLAIARINASTLREQTGDHTTAIALLEENREEQDAIHDSLVAHTESSISMAYLDLGEYDKAITTGIAAAKSFEKIADSVNAGFCYIIIGTVYSNGLANNTQAVHYLEEALRLLQHRTGPAEYRVTALLNLGDVLVKSEQYDAAVEYYIKARNYAIATGQLVYLPSVLYGLGKASYFTGEYEAALASLLEAIDLPNANMQVDIQLNKFLGLNYQALGQPEQAIVHYKRCLQHALEASSRNEFSGYLVECYQELGDYKTAFELQQAMMARQDSIKEAEQTEKVAAIIEQYEGEKKELKIEQLNQENAIKEARIAQQNAAIWSIVAMFIILSIGGFLWLRVR